MLQEIKNLPSLIQERWLEREVLSAIKESQLKASKIERRFTNVPYPLFLTYNAHELLQVLLALEVSKQDPRALTDPKLSEKVTSHFHRSAAQVMADMGFLGEDQILANLIYSPLLDIAQLWVKSYQDISIIGKDLDAGRSDRQAKLVAATMRQSGELLVDMRRLERAYHPLESQLTFRSV